MTSPLNIGPLTLKANDNMKDIFIKNYRKTRLIHQEIVEYEEGTLPMLSSLVLQHVMERANFPQALSDDEYVDIGVSISKNKVVPFLFISSDDESKLNCPSELQLVSAEYIREDRLVELRDQFELAQEASNSITALAETICRDYGTVELKQTSETQLHIQVEQ